MAGADGLPFIGALMRALSDRPHRCGAESPLRRRQRRERRTREMRRRRSEPSEAKGERKCARGAASAPRAPPGACASRARARLQRLVMHRRPGCERGRVRARDDAEKMARDCVGGGGAPRPSSSLAPARLLERALAPARSFVPSEPSPMAVTARHARASRRRHPPRVVALPRPPRCRRRRAVSLTRAPPPAPPANAAANQRKQAPTSRSSPDPTCATRATSSTST